MIPFDSHYASPEQTSLLSGSQILLDYQTGAKTTVPGWLGRLFAPKVDDLGLRPISWWRDLRAILAIEKASFAHPWSLSDFLCFAARPSTSGRVRTIGGEVVGYLLYQKDEDRLHIAHVAVRPDCRSLGLGREMIRSLGDRARRYVTLYVRKSNVKAQRLYYGLGFVVVRELPRHYGDGEDAFLMGYRGCQDVSSSKSCPTGSP